MMPRRRPFLAILCIFLCYACSDRTRDYVSLVDTRIGTASRFELSYGNTYPGTGRPFGMHLWSPQTGDNGDGWKYTWNAGCIRGFCQSHQCSPWTRDYASLSLFPESGKLQVLARERGAQFRHEDEVALPHRYSVKFKNGITTEMAPTERCNLFSFGFPEGSESFVVIDGCREFSEMKIDTVHNAVTGVITLFTRNAGTMKNWFIVEFDRPFTAYGSWKDPAPTKWFGYNNNSIIKVFESGTPECEEAGILEGAGVSSGYNAGVYLSFGESGTVQAKVASSYISMEQARINLERELGDGATLERTAEEGRKDWNEALGKISVEGGRDEDIRTFYACLYHASIFPRMIYEFDAEDNPHYFSPFDFTIHDGYMYTDIGYWDAFRSQFPLFNIIHREVQEKYMADILDIYDQRGWLPSWTFPYENSGMIGNHAISLLADAWAKGIRSFDPVKALEAYRHEITAKRDYNRMSHGRFGAKEFRELGYVPYPEYHYGTAVTLEYAYDDFCAWALAMMSGNEELAEEFGRTMYNYRNVFDRETGFMRGRGADGKWTPDFRPGAWGGPFIEGNAWHYNWSVFQDIQGLINLYGSDKAFTDKLDDIFSAPAIIEVGHYGEIFNEMVEMVVAGLGQYEHGNQPMHHVAYLYDYAGEPWKTQYWTRRIMSQLYNPGPKGYPGDEDQGSMSAWYVMSALGFYPVTPGTGQYAIGSPLFRKAVITLEDGKTFTVEAENNSAENVYIQSATLNGKPFERNWIEHSEIMAGGVLHFVMGPDPATDRCTGKDASPFSLSSADI